MEKLDSLAVISKHTQHGLALVGIGLFSLLTSIAVPILIAQTYLPDSIKGIGTLVIFLVSGLLLLLVIFPAIGRMARNWGFEGEFGSFEGWNY